MKINHICLMPGHSAKDGGAVVCGGPGAGLSEHALASRYLPEITRQLVAKGYTVSTTSRETAGGTTPSYSGKAALATGAQLVFEFHFNSAGATASGAEALYWHASSTGHRVAEIMAAACADALGIRNRGAKPRFDSAVTAAAYGYDASAARGAGLFTTCWNAPQYCVPVMVECAFAGSNEKDAVALLRAVANGELATAMADAIDRCAKEVETLNPARVAQ